MKQLYLDTKNNYSKQEKEYQAEMVAYTTCSYFGIDTSDYSLDYMYNWTRNMDFDECIEIIEEVISKDNNRFWICLYNIKAENMPYFKALIDNTFVVLNRSAYVGQLIEAKLKEGYKYID